MVLERAIPALEEQANAFLAAGVGAGGTFLRVEIEPFKDLERGEQKNEVVIYFVDERGKHILSEASGYQRIALGYALRCALALVQARAMGTKVNLAWLDEGWGAFDDEHLAMGQGMLRAIADAFNRVIYITHVGPIKEVAERTITVVPSALGSTIEIQ